MSNLKPFIGVIMIHAIAMDKGRAYEAGLLQKKNMPEPWEAHEAGYYIQYPDGYTSWCPKEAFDKKYLAIADATKISKEDVESFIVKGESHKLGSKTCVVLDSTITGFDTVGTSACVDPANYSQEIGEEIARRDITNTIWGHLGFVLQWAKNGIRPKRPVENQ